MGNQRNLVILVVAFVALGAFYFLSSRSRSDLDQSGGFVQLVDGPLSTAEVFGVHIHKGSEEGFRLAKQGDNWIMSTHYDAPANANKLRTLLGNIENAVGEVRSSDADALSAYALGDEDALHLQLQDESGNDILHLLIGKRSGSGGFVRFAGSNEAMRVDHNFLSDFGVWGEDITTPERNSWIELAAFKVDRNEVREIELDWPDGPLSMAKEFAAAADDSIAAEPDPSSYEWRVSQPSSFLAKKTAADGILGSIVNLRARDVVGVVQADSLGAWGLGDAADRIVVRMADGSSHELLFGGPNGDEVFYFQVAGEPLVWSLPNYLKTNIFKDPSTLKPE